MDSTLTVVFHFMKNCPACSVVKGKMRQIRSMIRKLSQGVRIKEYEHQHWTKMEPGDYPELSSFPAAPMVMVLPSSQAHRKGDITKAKVFNGTPIVKDGKNYIRRLSSNDLIGWLRKALTEPFPSIPRIDHKNNIKTNHRPNEKKTGTGQVILIESHSEYVW